MHPLTAVTIACLLSTLPVTAREPANIDQTLRNLQSQDIDTRQAAMVDIQYSLDPRIPDACLPVLQQEGDSIRRLAARAIGSRWHQIPKDRIPTFVKALQPQLKSEHEGLVNMARRGIALLEHDYKSPMVSRSRSKRWVIYERFGLPCLIDTKTQTEELLGFGSQASLSCAWGNSELQPAVFWHPKQDLVALDIILNRKSSTVWIWSHGKGLEQIDPLNLTSLLGHKKDTVVGSFGLFTTITGWTGNALDFTLSFATQAGDDIAEHEAHFRYNADTGKISVVTPTPDP
jgi:hypothetical protein